MDINSDLGESFGAWRMGDDATMLGIVTSANVACGFHAGDPAGILETLRAVGFTEVKRYTELGIFSEYTATKPKA